MKIRILILLHYYLPGYKSGGPIPSIVGLAEHVNEHHEFRVICYDRDKGDYVPYATVQENTWQLIDKTEVYYIPKSIERFAAIKDMLRQESYDLLYLQSVFNQSFTIWPLFLRWIARIPKRPILLASRGELSSGALSIKSYKKRFFLSIARLIGLFDGVHWQASSELEAKEIRNSGLLCGGQIYVACDLRVITPMPIRTSICHAKSTLRLVFVSRITPKKNLTGALRILKQIEIPIRFDIYGPIDRDKKYWNLCLRLIKELPANVEAIYHGPVAPTAIPEIFAKADAFLFPTLGENFGHVISEALLSGCPVLTSDQTPWIGLKEHECGVTLPPYDVDGFVNSIKILAATPREVLDAGRLKIRKFGIISLGLEQSISDHKYMFKSILDNI